MNEITKACYLALIKSGKINNWFDAAVYTDRMISGFSLRQELYNWHGIQINSPIRDKDAISAAEKIIVFYAIDERHQIQRAHDIEQAKRKKWLKGPVA